MASKTISITNEVYNLLSKLKLPDESFGDTIKRICNEKLASHLIAWMDNEVLWSDMEDDEYQGLLNSFEEIKYTMNEVQLP